MKSIIIYESLHHGNTKKLVDAIAAEYPVEICDARRFEGDLSQYDLIGFASGVAFGKFYNEIYALATDKMPFGKDLFFIFTAGNPVGDPARDIKALAEQRENRIHGAYCCMGYDTFGPLKLIGGINKGSPTEEEISGAVDYYRLVLMECELQEEIRKDTEQEDRQ